MPDVGLLLPGADVAPGSPAAGTDDVAVLRALLAVEAAWVRAQARGGLVEVAVAGRVSDVLVGLAADDTDALALAARVARDAAGGGNPVIPLLAHARAAVRAAGLPDGAVHASLTSQDVLDTALVLVLRAASRAASGSLDRCTDAVAGLAARFRDLPALGRTLTQPAAPTTWGARCATWLVALDAARAALVAATGALGLAFGGAAGTLAATRDLVARDRGARSGETAGVAGADGHAGVDGGSPAGADDVVLALVDAWGAELGLAVPTAPWHVVRAPVVDWAQAAGAVCAALGVLASDVLAAARAEVGEVREPAAPGRGGSSAMPHKHNPVLSVLLRRSALAAPPLAAQVLTAAGLSVDERPDGAWHAEWPALQLLARHTVAAAALGAELAAGLEIDADATARNLHAGLDVDPASADTGLAGRFVDRVLRAHATSAAGARPDDGEEAP